MAAPQPQFGRNCASMSPEFVHGHEPKAEEIALHQRYLTLLGQMEEAVEEGDQLEVRRIAHLLQRARRRWLMMNKRVARDH